MAQALGFQAGGSERDELGNLGARGQDTDAVKSLALDVFVLICRKPYQIMFENKDFGGGHTRVQVSVCLLVMCVALVKLLSPLTLVNLFVE